MWFSNHDIEALHKALEERRHAKAYALLDGLKEKLSGEDAAACLKAALSCSPGVFCRVLERCKSGEYAGWVRVELARGRAAYVRGTMLTGHRASAVQSAFSSHATLALEEQLGALTTAETANRTCISCHFRLPP